MDNTLRHRITYLILTSVVLYVLIVINFRTSVLSDPISASIISLSFFFLIAILILVMNPQLLNPNRKITSVDDYVAFISSITFLLISITLVNSFGTDDMEYIYEALNSLFQGKDPYAVTYYPQGVCPTYTLAGGIANTYIYPPLSFIIYIPLYVFLKVFDLPPYFLNLENIVFDVILATLIYIEGRKKEDPFALLPIIFIYIMTAVSIPPFYGVFVVIPTTFLAIAYVRKDKLGGTSLGLATMLTQLSWLALPFLLIYKLKTYESKKRFLREYLLPFSLSVSILTIPFLIWNSTAFITNVITTDSATIPVGQIGLSVISYSGFYPLEPWFFTISLGTVSLFLIYLYSRYFEAIRESIWVFPIIISWFLWRTLTEYFIMWIPLLFLSLYNIDYNKIPTVKVNFKRQILVPLFLLVTLLSSLAVYAHIDYVQSNPLTIEGVYPLGKLPYDALLIKVYNDKPYPVNITLVRVSIPNNLNMVWDFSSGIIPPNSTGLVFAYAPQFNESINSTVFTVQVYYNYYFATYTVNTSASNIS